MARPKANIDWNVVNKYLQAQCDGVGIAGLIGIDVDTFYRRCKEDNKIGFSEYLEIKRKEGKELLRAKQYQTAMDGDRTMLVWLGKQYLDQKDKSDYSHSGIPAPVNINVTSKENADKLKDFLDGKPI